jgi:antirestriction protein
MRRFKVTTWNDWLAEENWALYIETALEAYLKNEHKDFTHEFSDETWDKFKEAHMGQYDKFVDFVEERFREVTEIPEHLDNYIDFEKVARDWKYDYWVSDEGHIFRAY